MNHLGWLLVPEGFPKPIEVQPTGRKLVNMGCPDAGVTFSVRLDGEPLG